jgi:hypothetical protein
MYNNLIALPATRSDGQQSMLRGMLVGQIEVGRGIEEILADYPYLEREDIMQALRYAAWRTEEREVMLATAHERGKQC